MKLGSLFDGSGTCPLAASMLGVEPAWASEIEPYPVKVTTAIFPSMKHLGDITKIDGSKIEPVEIITFGSPCQDLSVAGKQKGLIEGERSNLFFEAIRIIKEMRNATDGRYPRFIMWENVPGAFSSNQGRDFLEVVRQIAKISGGDSCTIPEPEPKAGKIIWKHAGYVDGDGGWSIAWRVFDSQYWGVPQRRKRIYLVADFGGKCAGKILFESEGVLGDFAKSRETGEEASDHAVGSVDRTGGEKAITCVQNTGVGWRNEGEIAETLRTPCGGDSTKANLVVLNDQGGESVNAGTICGTLRAESHQHEPVIAFEPGISKREGGEKRSVFDKTPTLRANMGDNQIACTYSKEKSVISSTMENYRQIDFGISAPLKARDYKDPAIVCFPSDGEVHSLEGNGQRPSHQGDGYHDDNAMYTLNSTEVHGVMYGIDLQAGKGSANYATNVSPTMTAKDVHAVAYDGYNGTIDEIEACLGANCGMSTGRNGVIKRQRTAYDMTHASDVIRDCGEISPTLQNRMGTGGNQVPLTIETVPFAQNQRNEVRDLGEKTGALAAEAGVHQQTYLAQKVFDITGSTSNSMKSPTEDSCFREREVSRTLDGFVETPTCNQGGEVVVKAVGNGQMCNMSMANVANSLDCMHDQQAVLISKPKRRYIVRRLTPTECARLQGFPDWWCDGVEGSDSAKYKMWGNGMTLNVVFRVMQGIVRAFENEQRCEIGRKENDIG